jgi:hypothetical protein
MSVILLFVQIEETKAQDETVEKEHSRPRSALKTGRMAGCFEHHKEL